MLVATKGGEAMTADEWRERAGEYESSSYVGRELVKRMVEDLVVTLPDFSEAALFTDDYAPIETMPFSEETR
jgi:hypothetical protein